MNISSVLNLLQYKINNIFLKIIINILLLITIVYISNLVADITIKKFPSVFYDKPLIKFLTETEQLKSYKSGDKLDDNIKKKYKINFFEQFLVFLIILTLLGFLFTWFYLIYHKIEIVKENSIIGTLFNILSKLFGFYFYILLYNLYTLNYKWKIEKFLHNKENNKLLFFGILTGFLFISMIITIVTCILVATYLI